MARVYYNSAKGDGPKVVEHGGKNLVWLPKGEHWEWKKDQVIKEFMKGDKKVQVKGKKLVKTSKKGPAVSYLDLDREQTVAVMLQKNNLEKKLMLEKDYFKIAGVDDLDLQIAQLQAMKAEREAAAAPKVPAKKE
jgi:hypothetical protein